MKSFYNLIAAIFLMVALVLALAVSPALAGEGDEAVPFVYQRPADCLTTGTYYEDYGVPSGGNEPNHTGEDIGCPMGTKVQSSGAGQVVLVQQSWFDFGGMDVFILHGYVPETGFPFLTFYAHLWEVKVNQGDQVEAGQEIGTSGIAGTGAHFHWGAANQMPEGFASHYEHASEMADGRGWIDPRVPPKMLVPPSGGIAPSTSSASADPEVIYVVDQLPCEGMLGRSEEVVVVYQGVVVHHTVGGGGWKQAVSTHCGEDRPPYLLVIETDGQIYQLAEFGSVTYHALEPNNSTYASIALEGNMSQTEPTSAQLDSLVAAIVWLQKQGMGPEILGHRDVGNTECPGNTLYSLLPEIRQRVESGGLKGKNQSEVEAENGREAINGFQIWLEANEEVSQTLDFADKLGVINKQDVVNAIPWVIGGITLLILLVIYLLIRVKFGHKPKFVRVKRGRQSILVPAARRFYNRFFWLMAGGMGLIHLSQTDYVTRMVTGDFWWILLGISVFFWFLKEAEKSRVRWGRSPSSTVWIRDIVLSGALLVLAGWMYGNVVGMSFYILARDTQPSEAESKENWEPSYEEEEVPWDIPAGMQSLPADFVDNVRKYGTEITKIAWEEDVPPAVLFTLWLKESGGRMVNPGNGEGLCGFYSYTRRTGQYFSPGSIFEEELYRQMRICAQEFHRHVRVPQIVHFETTSLDVLGNTYMNYNGNIDCYGGSFASWRDHPYVMNGYDAEHQGMVARNGYGGCVALKIIGAIPAHIQIEQILRGIDPSLP